MRLLTTAMIAAIALSSSLLAAEERKLNGAEIEALLTDRSAHGEHRGKETRQYFRADGRTFYQAEGTWMTQGKWKVDHERGKYCSHWEPGGWGCYDVTFDGQRYYWSLPNRDYHSPFTMVDGEDLKF